MGKIIPDAKTTGNDHDRRSLEAVHSLKFFNTSKGSLGVVAVGHRLLYPVFVAWHKQRVRAG